MQSGDEKSKQGLSTQPVDRERAAESAPIESSDLAIQVVLSRILEAPERQMMPVIREIYPGCDIQFYAPVVSGVRELIQGLIGGLQKPADHDPSPTLLDRLSFSWRILRQADVLLYKTKKSDMLGGGGLQHAASTYYELLPVPLREPLLKALLSKLRLGEDARYLYQYWAFRRAKTPSELPPPFERIARTQNLELLRTLIWWCIRARKEQYVEVRPNEPVRVAFDYVVEEVVQDLKGWCGNQIENFPDIGGEVERELTAWLAYSRLDLSMDDSASDLGPDPEIAKAFLKHNELTTKLKIQRAGPDGKNDERVRQLEAQVRQYAEENRALEERLRQKQEPSRVVSTPQGDSDSTMAQFAELREMLKVIDAKYAFDTLNSVQLGEDTHLTLRSFISHLFYALRKRGFSEYPKEDSFVLTYEASGLYDCDGFEIPPAGSMPVKVTRKGWAFESRGKWLPVRRARVVAIEK